MPARWSPESPRVPGAGQMTGACALVPWCRSAWRRSDDRCLRAGPRVPGAGQMTGACALVPWSSSAWRRSDDWCLPADERVSASVEVAFFDGHPSHVPGGHNGRRPDGDDDGQARASMGRYGGRGIQPCQTHLETASCPHASCLMPHASCLMPRASCLMPSCLVPRASCLAQLSTRVQRRCDSCSRSRGRTG